MKTKFNTIILFLIMIFLIFAIVILAMAIYLDITKVGTTDVIYAVKPTTADIDKTPKSNKNEIITNEIVSEEIKTTPNPVKESTTFFYYDQLNDTQKKLYDGLKNNKDNMTDGKYQISYGNIFTDVLNQNGGNEKLGNDYQSAVEAFLYDNPDVFYIDANKLYLNIETKNQIIKKSYNVSIGPADGSTYYAKGFSNQSQVQNAIKQIEITKNNILSNLPQNKYDIILKIHDYLINNIEYDKEYSSIGCYSIYGAIIDRTCVCEGYAKTFKYLVNEAGVPCEIVQGTARNSSGKTENHAWNIVCINNKWYYIDATWDDPIIVGSGTISESVHYKYFLKGKETMDKDHTLSNQFSSGGKVFSYPKPSEEDYN